MGKIIAITNQKGEAGKKTTALGLTARLKAKGKKVLLVDMDAQGNASAAAGLIIENDIKTLKDPLKGKAHPYEFIVRSEIFTSGSYIKNYR